MREDNENGHYRRCEEDLPLLYEGEYDIREIRFKEEMGYSRGTYEMASMLLASFAIFVFFCSAFVVLDWSVFGGILGFVATVYVLYVADKLAKIARRRV